MTTVSTYDYKNKEFKYYEVDETLLNKTPSYGHRLPKGKNVKNSPETLAMILPSDARYIGKGGKPIGQICCCAGHSNLSSFDSTPASAISSVVNLAVWGLTLYGGYSLYNHWKGKKT